MKVALAGSFTLKLTEPVRTRLAAPCGIATGDEELPRVVLTPHVSGSTDGTLETHAQIIADNIAWTVRGEAPLNAISPSRVTA